MDSSRLVHLRFGLQTERGKFHAIFSGDHTGRDVSIIAEVEVIDPKEFNVHGSRVEATIARDDGR